MAAITQAVFAILSSGERPPDPWNGQRSFFILDCAITEEHSSEVQITEHPVETGGDVTDNARPKPDLLTIEGLISNTPIGPFWGFYDPNSQVTTSGYQFPIEIIDGQTGPGRTQAAFDLLRDLKDSSTPLNITTALKFYPVMLIESLHFPRTSQIGDSLKFTMKLRAVRFVNSQTAIVQVRTTNAQGHVKKGPQTTNSVQDNRTAALKLADKVAGGKAALFNAQFPRNNPPPIP